MDIYFAMFNCHVNNAKQRALEEIKRTHPEWVQEIEAEVAAGAMGIFHKDPTPATLYFAELVQKFVNE